MMRLAGGAALRGHQAGPRSALAAGRKAAGMDANPRAASSGPCAWLTGLLGRRGARGRVAAGPHPRRPEEPRAGGPGLLAAALVAEAQDLLTATRISLSAAQSSRLEAVAASHQGSWRGGFRASRRCTLKSLPSPCPAPRGFPRERRVAGPRGWKTSAPTACAGSSRPELPRTRPSGEAPPITGEPEADARIAHLATAAGTALRPCGSRRAGFPGSLLLQTPALEALHDAGRAASEGVSLKPVSGTVPWSGSAPSSWPAAAQAEGARAAVHPRPNRRRRGGTRRQCRSAGERPPGFSRQHGVCRDLDDPTGSGDSPSSPPPPASPGSRRPTFSRQGVSASCPATRQGPRSRPGAGTLGVPLVGEGVLAAPAQATGSH